MKDYYSSLHKFLSSHFPAQIHKLEAIKGNDVEVIKMYNMYKQLAKDKLQERQESADTESKSQEWPKEITSRYSDEYKIKLQKVTPTHKGKPGKAKYHVVDIESGEVKGTPVFGSIDSLEAFADDLIKPQGGRQSTNLGEGINNPATVSKVAKGINTAINNVDESLHYRDFAKAVAITLKENYGTHNIAPFMEVLHAELGINEVKVESLEEGKSEHIVKHSESNNTYQVWLGDEIVTDFATKERADAEAKRLNALQSVNEAKATCCHRCGRVHVKGTPCKKPYLKGKDSCAINEIKTLKEFYNK